MGVIFSMMSTFCLRSTTICIHVHTYLAICLSPSTRLDTGKKDYNVGGNTSVTNLDQRLREITAICVGGNTMMTRL